MSSLIVLCAKYLFVVPPLLLLYALWRADGATRRQTVTRGLIAVVLAVGLAKGGGALYNEPRPFAALHLAPLIPHAADNGFPSDHTLLVFCCVFLLLPLSRPLAAAALVAACGVGAARVASLLHSPLDIGASVAFAAASVGGVVACNQRGVKTIETFLTLIDSLADRGLIEGRGSLRRRSKTGAEGRLPLRPSPSDRAVRLNFLIRKISANSTGKANRALPVVGLQVGEPFDSKLLSPGNTRRVGFVKGVGNREYDRVVVQNHGTIHIQEVGRYLDTGLVNCHVPHQNPTQKIGFALRHHPQRLRRGLVSLHRYFAPRQFLFGPIGELFVRTGRRLRGGVMGALPICKRCNHLKSISLR